MFNENRPFGDEIVPVGVPATEPHKRSGRHPFVGGSASQTFDLPEERPWSFPFGRRRAQLHAELVYTPEHAPHEPKVARPPRHLGANDVSMRCIDVNVYGELAPLAIES